MTTAMEQMACETARTERDAPRRTQRVRSPGFGRWDVASTGVGHIERPRYATPWPPAGGTPNPAKRRQARRASRRWLGVPALAGGAWGAPALGKGSARGIRCLGRLKAGLRTSGSAAASPRVAGDVRRLGLAVAPAHRARLGISPLSLAPGFTDCVKTAAPWRRSAGATELRQTVAHGVSRGLHGRARRAAERRQNRTQIGGQTGLSAAPPGLGRLCALDPRLTPWATLCRCSAAWLPRPMQNHMTGHDLAFSHSL